MDIVLFKKNRRLFANVLLSLDTNYMQQKYLESPRDSCLSPFINGDVNGYGIFSFEVNGRSGMLV